VPLLAVRPVLLAIALASTGCSGTGGPNRCSFPVISVGDALKNQPKQPVFVEGHYLKRGGVVQLCDQLVGAVPESCAGLAVPGYSPV